MAPALPPAVARSSAFRAATSKSSVWIRTILTSGDGLKDGHFIAGAHRVGGFGVKLVNRYMQSAGHVAQIWVALQQGIGPLLDGAFLRPVPGFLTLAGAFGYLGKVQDT